MCLGVRCHLFHDVRRGSAVRAEAAFVSIRERFIESGDGEVDAGLLRARSCCAACEEICP